MPSGTYYLTSYATDVPYGGVVYTATTMSRGNLQVAQDLTGREFVVYLPISHPVVQHFASSGIPDRELVITKLRLQATSAVAIQEATGFGTGLSVDGRTALIRVPSVSDDAMKLKLPVVGGQRLCNHRLGDRLCSRIPGSDGPDLEALKVPTSIVSVSGTTIVVASVGGNADHWARFGNFLHNATGERREVLSQVGTTLTINVPFVDAAAGHAVSVYPGCDHLVLTCRNKFVNVANFGGHPYMTTRINPFAVKGIGVIVQT